MIIISGMMCHAHGPLLEKRKMKKRILLDTKKNLNKSFLKEDPNVKFHYSYFSKFKPFYVVPPSVDSRETCMCKLHANIAFMRVILYKNKVIKTNDMNQIILQTVCDINSLPLRHFVNHSVTILSPLKF